MEAVFTDKDVRVLITLPSVAMVPLDVDGLLTDEVGKEGGGGMTRQQKRMLEVLKKGSKSAYGSTNETWSLDFYRSPIGPTIPLPPYHSSSSFSSPSSSQQVELNVAHTKLDPYARRAIPTTGQTSTLITSLVITSLGFRAESTPAVEPFYDPELELGRLRTVGDARVLALVEGKEREGGREG